MTIILPGYGSFVYLPKNDYVKRVKPEKMKKTICARPECTNAFTPYFYSSGSGSGSGVKRYCGGQCAVRHRNEIKAARKASCQTEK